MSNLSKRILCDLEIMRSGEIPMWWRGDGAAAHRVRLRWKLFVTGTATAEKRDGPLVWLKKPSTHPMAFARWTDTVALGPDLLPVKLRGIGKRRKR